MVGECVGFVCGRKRGGHICIGPVYMCDKKNYTVDNHLFVSHTIVCFISQVALRWVTQQGIVVATSPGGNAQYVTHRDTCGIENIAVNNVLFR